MRLRSSARRPSAFSGWRRGSPPGRKPKRSSADDADPAGLDRQMWWARRGRPAACAPGPGSPARRVRLDPKPHLHGRRCLRYPPSLRVLTVTQVETFRHRALPPREGPKLRLNPSVCPFVPSRNLVSLRKHGTGLFFSRPARVDGSARSPSQCAKNRVLAPSPSSERCNSQAGVSQDALRWLKNASRWHRRM